ncbi:hypothetical protein [Calothrix sp. PCC 7507]|uniref:hypothetical protein n=1 Tax=Calothrix sp. PCC 7507 TaxID=99598 RepID=UPI00029F0E2F|nr:hypothetical protein [Calothrix sp. PCC 7507]AFY34749.1 hypothetical protein Cal7507_4378 [Calothrix sp. PCC 7507]
MNRYLLGATFDLFSALFFMLSAAFAIGIPTIKLVYGGVESISGFGTSSRRLNSLFANDDAVGVLAICVAEGNCEINGRKTRNYFANIDPGNGLINRGWCSDQGRGGSNLKNADAGCLSRTQSRIPRLMQRMERVGLNPEHYVEAFVNAADLWNQASPRVSDAFPNTYRIAIEQGFKGQEAILWARVEAFRDNSGELSAGNINLSRGVYRGLFGVCANPQNTYYQSRLRNYSLMSEKWRWSCIALDQRRRVKAIQSVFTRIS